jgi:hypothetical protein
MKNLKYIFGLGLASLLVIVGCKEDTFEFGDLNAPSNLVINTDVVGESGDNPNGDGSGEVHISIAANNAITYHIGFNKIDDYSDVNYKVLPSGALSQKFTSPGVNTYRISVIAYGPGGTATNASKDITVRSDFIPDASIVSAITNDASKAWIVDKDVPAHFGVGPWGETSPVWWSAGVDEKLEAAPCFYSTTFTFTKNANGTYQLDVDASADGAFTKTGDLTSLPGVPAEGDEGCYAEYSGGSGSFNFVPASSGIEPSDEFPSTQTAMKLGSSDIYIGYGALQDEYEIIEITPDFMYLRVQGTETGNGWWLKLKPLQ